MKGVELAILFILIFGLTASATLVYNNNAVPGELSLISAQADPIKVRPGDNLKVLVEFRTNEPIKTATAKFNHEKGFDEVPLSLVASMPDGRYTFVANWEVHSTLDQVWYTTDFEITTQSGLTLLGQVNWQDPTVSHGAEQVNPGSFQNGTYTFPGTTTLTTVTCTSGECVPGSVVDESSLTCAEITGSSALCDGSDATADGDTSSSNEIQTLGTSGSSITLTSGGSVIAPDLSCTNCIGGTEIDESSLSGNAPSLFTGTCRSSSGNLDGDICIDSSNNRVCTKNSCADGTCNGCGGSSGFFDLIITCDNGEIAGINTVSSAAC